MQLYWDRKRDSFGVQWVIQCIRHVLEELGGEEKEQRGQEEEEEEKWKEKVGQIYARLPPACLLVEAVHWKRRSNGCFSN